MLFIRAIKRGKHAVTEIRVPIIAYITILIGLNAVAVTRFLIPYLARLAQMWFAITTAFLWVLNINSPVEIKRTDFCLTNTSR